MLRGGAELWVLYPQLYAMGCAWSMGPQGTHPPPSPHPGLIHLPPSPPAAVIDGHGAGAGLAGQQQPGQAREGGGV